MIKIKDLNYFINDKKILKDISFKIAKGSIYGIIGPNGSGKTTLLKHLYKGIFSKHQIFINDSLLEDISFNEYAKICSVVTQNHDSIDKGLQVQDITLMGRYPYKTKFQPYNDFDHKIAFNALKKVGLCDHKTQLFSTLSGGEQQRTLLAKAFAQEADILIMDEPTNHLDLKHQLALKKLLKEYKGTVILTLHDLNFASQLCDRLLLLKNGQIVSEGSPSEVLKNEFLTTAYELSFNIDTLYNSVNITPIYE